MALNYYEHHLGDYMRDTAHLSMLEDAAYRRLLDAYYIRERALPADLRDCYKLTRATTKAERDAVAYVLREFFILQDDGHHQIRADAEIARFKAKSDKARESVNKRWERTKNVQGPKNEGNTNVSTEAYERTTNDIHRAPVPRHQSPYSVSNDTEKRAKRVPPPDDVDPQVWSDWLALRKQKRATVTQTVLEGARSEASKAGMPLEAFLRIWCRRGSQGLEASWLKPEERVSVVQKSFRDRDAEAAAQRFREMTGGILDKPKAEVIDVTPRLLG